MTESVGLGKLPYAGESTDIAIVGMSGRFPGAGSVRQFWENLKAGIESIARFERRDDREPGPDGSIFVGSAGILEDVEGFDAGLFGMSPRQAAITDPQHRVFLECAWEALEDAGCLGDVGTQRVAVYAGAGTGTYLLRNLRPNAAKLRDLGEAILHQGNAPDHLATRASFKLGLTGASVTVQSACSTSLLAVHLGCQSLLTRESDIALAGGVSIMTPQTAGYWYTRDGIMSPDGRCLPFASSARGTVFGSGAGVVVLRRLDDALESLDHVYAVIKGTAVNNDGALKASFSAPSPAAQEAVISEALAVSGVHPRTIGYVEAHGTGTALGDPIEVEALTAAYRAQTDETGYCAIGSLKANVGHLDAASGVAGLIKTTMTVAEGVVPPTLHCEPTNPEIEFVRTPFFPAAELAKWPREEGPRRAGVSAFGVGGTNVHVIVEQAPEREAIRRSRDPELVVLSARSTDALGRLRLELADHLEANETLSPSDVAWTLQVGRRALRERWFAVASSRSAVIGALRSDDGCSGRATAGSQRLLEFCFRGRAAGEFGSWSELLSRFPACARHVERCARELSAGHAALATAGGRAPGLEGAVARLFARQIALAGALGEWGIEPASVCADGVGRFAAGWMAGVFDLPTACALVAASDSAAPHGAERESLFRMLEGRLRRPRVAFRDATAGDRCDEPTDPDYWIGVAFAKHDAHDEAVRIEGETRRLDVAGLSFEDSFSGGPHAATGAGSDVARLLQVAGRCWSLGARPRWPRMAEGRQAGRVPLPTYPFERRRCWVDPPAAVSTREPIPHEPDAVRLFVPSWRRLATRRAGVARGRADWMLFARRGPMAEALRKSLEARGASVTLVVVGGGFARRAEREWEIDSMSVERLDPLFRQLASDGIRPDGILFAEATPGEEVPSAPLRAPDTGAYEALRSLARAADRRRSGRPLDLAILASDVHRVIGNERVDPTRAMLEAYCRVLPEEMRGMACRLLDVPSSGSDRIGNLAELLASDLLAGPDGGSVAYRGSNRWGPCLEPLDAKEIGPTRLRNGGVYVLTGGLGGLGLALAKALAREYRARLVLIGRAPVPGRDEWMASSGAPSPSERNERLVALHELGRTARSLDVIEADVTSPDALAAAIRQVLDRHGVVHGVVHAAGTAGGSAIHASDHRAAEQVLGPKVFGAANLMDAVDGLLLDFVALFSSTNALFGGFGQLDYCAGNLYLDALAESLEDRNPFTVSINWDTWREVGMAVRQPAHGALATLQQRALQTGLRSNEGWAAFRTILGADQRRVVASKRSLDEYFGRVPKGEHALWGSEPAPSPGDRLPDTERRKLWETLLGDRLRRS